MNAKITFVIFTYNEEKRIERVIRNFIGHGKVLLADDHSTDRTLEIAKSYGCDVYFREKSYAFVENQELVDKLYQVIDTDWIYWGFADEMLEVGALDRIIKVIDENKYSIINIDRKNYFFGRFCYNMYHARTNKIFKKHAIDFTNNQIHGMGNAVVDKSQIYWLNDKYFVHHFISNTAASYLNVINRYTDVELINSRSEILQVVKLIKDFITQLIVNKGYKAGKSGLALFKFMAIYSLIAQIKVFEKQEDLTGISIESCNNIIREKIINKLVSN